jgi:hypothetical protein
MGRCVVVVQTENGRIAAAYNEDGFSSVYCSTINRNGFIVYIEEDGSCGVQYDRNAIQEGIYNTPSFGPRFNEDLGVSSNCHINELSGRVV